MLLQVFNSCCPQFQPPHNLSYPLPLPSFFLFRMLLSATVLALFLTPSLQFVKLFLFSLFPKFLLLGHLHALSYVEEFSYS